MVKYFSVDWLAQSHNSSAVKEEQRASPLHRPHVICMVQPSAPTFGKGYLQPKPKTSKAAKQGGPDEVRKQQDANSPLHPGNCISPSTFCDSICTFYCCFCWCRSSRFVTLFPFLALVSELSGYSSGYESEAALSECPSVDEGNETEKDAPQRRMRTKFSPEQISRLEKIFSKHKYLDAGERVKTAQKLNLTETQVTIYLLINWLF